MIYWLPELIFEQQNGGLSPCFIPEIYECIGSYKANLETCPLFLCFYCLYMSFLIHVISDMAC